ncbi:hypothetical protein QCA50_007461 [Cerrena zonata]|uniref:DUF6534 domain-containing protein n=1 Tax=Cerrena zonata TaxID=2478898 RepID=A0AAW0GA18_9APHY
MSAPPGLPPIPPIIAQLTGPLLLGHFFNWGLFGALTVQTYIYYLAFPYDRLLPKCIVGFTFVIELLQTVLATKDAFRNFGTGWGNMADLDAVGLLWFSVPVLGSIISCAAQLFYAWRVRILGRNNWIVAIIVVLSFVQCGAGIYSGGLAHVVGRFSEVQKRGYINTCIWLGGTALCDVIIAASMIFYLHKSKTGFYMTSTLLTRFIRLTVETGLTCATFAILDLALFLAFQENNYHLAPSIALSKLYSNSLLVVFNARVTIVAGRNPPQTNEMSTLGAITASQFSTTVVTRRHSATHYDPKNQSIPIAINVSQHKECESDGTSGRDSYAMGEMNKPGRTSHDENETAENSVMNIGGIMSVV